MLEVLERALLEQCSSMLCSCTTLDVNSRSRWLETPLSHAAENGDQAVVELLLSRPDVDPGPRDNWGRTPLSFAAGSGHEAVVGQLQRSGCVGFNFKTDRDWAILLSSAENRHKAVVRLAGLGRPAICDRYRA